MAVDDLINIRSEGNADTERGQPGQVYTTPTDPVGWNDWTSDSHISRGNANSDMGQWQVNETYKGKLRNPVYYNEIGMNRDPDVAFRNLLGWGNLNGPPSVNKDMPVRLVQPTVSSPQRMAQYEQLGSMVTGMSRAPDQPLDLGDGSLTGGFNKDWLSQALAAGSANGAKIGGMGSGGGGGGGGKPPPGGGGGGMGGGGVEDPSYGGYAGYGGGAGAGWAGPGTGG
jgi:hypothetical protein